ncbi:MAG: tripartite tricarboxylate transporter permease, partial [Nitratireductor sp.]
MSDILVAIGTYFSDLGTGLMGGAEMFMTWNNVLTIFFGVFIGCFFGALPGLSISLAVAFVLPFSFSLEPLTALSLLSAVYVGAIYGGSISAILFNTPGTPAAACTTADGFALTKQNRAGKALQMANLASMVGDVTSTVLVILLFPLLAQVAIYFKSPEYFALILFAVMIVGSLSGKSLVLGLISAALGFALSTIGMDPIEGSGRFDFGNVNLLSGISFVPLLIGMFALPEFVAQLTRARRHDKPSAIARSVEVDSNDKLTREEFRTSLPHMVRGGLIGLVLGVIPGLG